MQKTLYMFNFKKLPGGFLLALCLLIGTLYIINMAIDKDTVTTSAERSQYREFLAKIREVKASYLIIGNSRAACIKNKILDDILFNGVNTNGFNLILGGNTPRTSLFILESVKYTCIKEGGLAILCLTPIDLNRFNKTFNRTIGSFFTLKDIFCEFIINNRTDNVEYYFAHCSSFFREHCRRAVKKIILFLQGKDALLEEPFTEDLLVLAKDQKTALVIGWYRDLYYKDYTIDRYQINSIYRIIEGLKKRDIQTFIVLLPLSKDLRDVLTETKLKLFIDTAYSIANKYSTPLLDYISSYPGDEYDYSDASHLSDESAKLFSERLAVDMKKIIKNNRSAFLTP